MTDPQTVTLLLAGSEALLQHLWRLTPHLGWIILIQPKLIIRACLLPEVDFYVWRSRLAELTCRRIQTR